MHGTARVMLCFHFNDPFTRPWDKFHLTDHWQTATGRLLISHLKPAEAQKVCAACGAEYSAEYLHKLRQDGMVCFEHDGLVIIGHAVLVPGFPVMAFGFGVKPEFRDRAIELSAAAAAEIRSRLLPQLPAY
jgi:hypothetical protein